MITTERVMDDFAESALCPACSKLTPYIVSREEWHQKRCGLKSAANFKRIHIIGGPGSGKTTLARRVGACVGTKIYELDQVAFAGRDYIERPLAERVADVSRIASRSEWITEGFFVLWTEELLKSADIIVWLDQITWRQSILRIARRYVQSAFQEAKKRQGLQRFTRFHDYARHVKQFVDVFFSSRAYYTGRAYRTTDRIETRPSTASFLKAFQDKVVHCQSDEAVEAFVDYIRLCHEKSE